MAIELKSICKSYDGKQVLDNVNITLLPGEITCIMGVSGIGKTTLVNILAGTVKPDSSEITGLQKGKISAVFQEDRLLEWETALSNVLFVTNPAREYIDKAKALLAQVGLEDSIHKKTAELSGGMKRRVCICRALIADYDLLILDEPYKGLDETTKENMIQLILDCVPKTAAALCVTHDTSEAIRLGGHVITL